MAFPRNSLFCRVMAGARRAWRALRVYSVAPLAKILRPIVELKMIRVKRLEFAASQAASIEPVYVVLCAIQNGGHAYKWSSVDSVARHQIPPMIQAGP